MKPKPTLILAALAAVVPAGGAAAQEQDVAAPAPTIESLAPVLRARFEEYMASAHVPGMVYGVVKNGKLVLVQPLGVRDLDGRKPVDADTRFRIASMSKAFTALAILKLRDEGKLRLDDPVSNFVPEVAGWKLPTSDAPPITVGDLMHHTAGLVEDNPWGDRQQVLTEAEFTEMMQRGMRFAYIPGAEVDYSNYGFALLGRIITNVSGKRYQDYIRDEIMLPLGMTSTTYDVLSDPPSSRAIGYRWQDGGWVREPDMADGVFGAMGGVETTANDYAKWVAFILSAWPASDAPDSGPVRRSTVRAIAMRVTPWGTIPAPADDQGNVCAESASYSAGWFVQWGCGIGRNMRHTGGYPGYGSAVALLPDAGVGMFAFSARTYSSGRSVVYSALRDLREAGAIPERAVVMTPSVALAYDSAKAAWTKGDPAAAPLANNVAMDETLDRRRKAIAALKAKVGTCDQSAPIVPENAMQGSFVWACERGAVKGMVQLAPTGDFLIQRLDFRENGAPE